MFDGVVRSHLHGSRLLLSRDLDDQASLELESTVYYLRGRGSDLLVRTITEFENVWFAGGDRVSAESYVQHTNYVDMPTLRPVSLSERSKTRFGLSAEFSLANERIYGFQGEHFLGAAERASLYISSADETRAAVEFHAGDDTSGNVPFVNVSIQLAYEEFQSTFKPLWLGSRHATIDVTIGVCGFRSVDMSDGTVDHFVMATGAWSADLTSLILSIAASR